MTDLVKESQDACAVALRAYGFVPKRRGLLLKPGKSKAVTGWLGLNLSTWELPAKIQINPVVGVRHVPLEAALVELAGWVAPVASVTRPLGYLMPQKTFLQWDVLANGDFEAVGRDIATSVAEFGQPFIDHWSDWETYSSEIGDSGLLLDVQRHFVLPIVAAINGDRGSAEQLIQNELARVGDSRDAYADKYHEFAERFFKKGFR